MSTYTCVRNSAWHVVGSNAATIIVIITDAVTGCAPKKPGARHSHGGPDTCVRLLEPPHIHNWGETAERQQTHRWGLRAAGS